MTGLITDPAATAKTKGKSKSDALIEMDDQLIYCTACPGKVPVTFPNVATFYRHCADYHLEEMDELMAPYEMSSTV